MKIIPDQVPLKIHSKLGAFKNIIIKIPLTLKLPRVKLKFKTEFYLIFLSKL